MPKNNNKSQSTAKEFTSANAPSASKVHDENVSTRPPQSDNMDPTTSQGQSANLTSSKTEKPSDQPAKTASNGASGTKFTFVKPPRGTGADQASQQGAAEIQDKPQANRGAGEHRKLPAISVDSPEILRAWAEILKKPAATDQNQAPGRMYTKQPSGTSINNSQRPKANDAHSTSIANIETCGSDWPQLPTGNQARTTGNSHHLAPGGPDGGSSTAGRAAKSGQPVQQKSFGDHDGKASKNNKTVHFSSELEEDGATSGAPKSTTPKKPTEDASLGGISESKTTASAKAQAQAKMAPLPWVNVAETPRSGEDEQSSKKEIKRYQKMIESLAGYESAPITSIMQQMSDDAQFLLKPREFDPILGWNSQRYRALRKLAWKRLEATPKTATANASNQKPDASSGTSARPDQSGNPFIRLMASDVGRQVYLELSESFVDMTSLSQACYLLSGIVAGYADRWDLYKGEFNDCEVAEIEIREYEEILQRAGKYTHPIEKRGISGLLVVSPARMWMTYTEGLCDPIESRRRKKYLYQLNQHARAFRALHLVGNHLRYLYLQHMDFLDVPLVHALLPSLTQLEVLGIHQCLLIQFKHTGSLLEAVDAAQRRNKKPIKLDFSPRYFTGPRLDIAKLNSLQSGRLNGKGEFGLSPRDLSLDTRRAVGCLLVYDILPRVLQSGQTHWLKPNSSFRMFLERLPLPDYFVIRVLAAYMFKINIVLQGRNLTTEEHVRYDVSLCRAVFGDTGLAEPRDKILMRLAGVWCPPRRCARCKLKIPDYFFYQPLSNVCDGCKLKDEEWSEEEHYIHEKRIITDVLLGDPNTTNLAATWSMDSPGFAWANDRIPEIFEAKCVARQLDALRHEDRHKGIDKEKRVLQPTHPFTRSPNQMEKLKYFEQQTWDRMLAKRHKQDMAARKGGKPDGYVMPPIDRPIISPRQRRGYPAVTYNGEDIAWEENILLINAKNERSVDTLPLEVSDPMFPRWYG